MGADAPACHSARISLRITDVNQHPPAKASKDSGVAGPPPYTNLAYQLRVLANLDPGCTFFRGTALDSFNGHVDKIGFLESPRSIQGLPTTRYTVRNPEHRQCCNGRHHRALRRRGAGA